MIQSDFLTRRATQHATRSAKRSVLALALLGAATPVLTTGVLAQGVDIPLQPSGPLVQPGGTGTAPTSTTQTAPKPAAQYTEAELRALGQGIAFPYALLDRTLRNAVNERGEVSYGLLKNDAELETFVRALSIAETDNFPVWKEKNAKGEIVEDRTAELAFWINAYNGLFLNAVANAYPLESVDAVKDFEEAKTRVVGGKSYSFRELREKIVKMDPRAVFVLLDGTKTGPRAPQGAARFLALGAQLNAAIKAFVNDPSRVQSPNRLQNEVSVSPFLEKVNPYFEPKGRRRKLDGVRNLLAAYVSNSADRNFFGTGDYEVKFLPRDSKLNIASTR